MLRTQPVILCGGIGARLWPISTHAIPKQFITIENKGSLIQETIRRVNGITPTTPLLVMNVEHKSLQNIDAYSCRILYEPYANDTAVAVFRAALEIKKEYPEEKVIMLTLPADHYIENIENFTKDIISGLSQVTSNNIVLFGIDPISPETKYGYIIPGDNGITFEEKPNEKTAIELIKKGSLWNSGIFCGEVDLILKCLQKSSHNVMDWIEYPREGKAASFDVAVLQEYDNIIAYHCGNWNWSDVGGWDFFMKIPEVQNELKKCNNVHVADCSDVQVLNRGSGTVLVLGCSNLLVAVNGSNILVTPKTSDFNSLLKNIVTNLKK